MAEEPFSDIREWREDIAKSVKNCLDGPSVVVASPDHPLLFDGPDLIISTPGKLLGIFIPKAVELRSKGRFENRVKLARAALPPHSVFVSSELGSERVTSPTIFTEVLQGLDLYLEHGKEQSKRKRGLRENVLQQISKLSGETRNVRQRDLHIGKRIFRTFSEIFKANQKSFDSSNIKRDRPYDETRDYSRRTRIQESFSSVEIMEGRSSKDQIRRVIYAERHNTLLALEEDFVAFKNKLPGVIIVNNKIDQRYDPDKYLRAISFAGWFSADDDDDLRIAAGLTVRLDSIINDEV